MDAAILGPGAHHSGNQARPLAVTPTPDSLRLSTGHPNPIPVPATRSFNATLGSKGGGSPMDDYRSRANTNGDRWVLSAAHGGHSSGRASIAIVIGRWLFILPVPALGI